MAHMHARPVGDGGDHPHGPQTTPESARALAAMRERDRQVLEEIATGDDTQVGFQGIKRRLDLHPEALRRVLRRLQGDGFVEKRDFGYALSDAGHRLLAGRMIQDEHVRPTPVAGLLLPSHVTPGRVIEALARRWFDGLHWYGLAEGMGEATLTWLTERGGDSVRLRVGMGRVRIEAALRDAGTDQGLAAAAPLVAAVAGLLREPDRATPQAS